MKKLITGLLATAALLTSTSASAAEIKDRPANASGDAPPIDARIFEIGQAKAGLGPEGVGYWEVYYKQPDTITVSIYNLSSNGTEGAYLYNTTVPFDSYVKDVLPNEWTDSWGNTSAGMNSLYAGALAVKTYGWYHVIAWKKDPDRNAHVSNGTRSQVYKAGSNKINSNNAVYAVRNQVIVNSSGGIFETGYRSDVTTPGTLMSQNGTYQDAVNGMWYGDIIKKWYSSYGGRHAATQIFVQN